MKFPTFCDERGALSERCSSMGTSSMRSLAPVERFFSCRKKDGCERYYVAI